MANEKRAPVKRVSIKLTPEQQQQVKQAIGRGAEALELSLEELEERIAPKQWIPSN